jgi:hypothetical protein
MYISVGTDRERCGAQLRAFTLAYHGPQCDVGANCAFGPSDIRRDEPGLPLRPGAYRMLGPTCPDMAQVRRMAHEVTPCWW